MLELKNITKEYLTGGETVHALKGISLQFRKNEFVAILGPSGCGKTTMLNIIGGLDQYTDGDLVINGVSTKSYKDRDWDSYRNHSVGFVFQSYNLIPHQNVLQNVELALTLSGVGKAERRKKAKEALEKVGLGDQLKKKPSEMSGGQMQRVAIARAIVNNPDIILADEPTGALDTETSVQVMDILKEISKDCLVVMVTHNPELAEKYATRIIRVLDGLVTDDSCPIRQEETESGIPLEDKKKKKLPSMSFATSFGLSLKNLFSKRGRTVLTSFAGSIGIIGIALIYAVSQGTTNYIDQVQEETLSSYPLTLEEETVDLSSLMTTFMGQAESNGEHENDAVYQKSMVYKMVNALNNLETNTNDLGAFKEYLEDCLEDEESKLSMAMTGVQYSYDLPILVYTENIDGNILLSDATERMQSLISKFWGVDMVDVSGVTSTNSNLSSLMSMSSSSTTQTWQQILPGLDGTLVNPMVEKQYDVIYGRWPEAYDEAVIILDENNELDDITLYALGLISDDEIDEIMNAAKEGSELEEKQSKWDYEEICERVFKIVLPGDLYTKNETSDCYTNLSETETGLKYLYNNALQIKIVGVLRPNEDAVSGMISGAVAYTSALTDYVIEKTEETESVQAQRENPEMDILTGLPFKKEEEMTTQEKAEAFDQYVEEMEDSELAEAYIQIKSVIDEESIAASTEPIMESMTREDMEQNILQAITEEMGVDAQTAEEYISAMSEEDLQDIVEEALQEQVRQQYSASMEEQFSYMTEEQLAEAFRGEKDNWSIKEKALYYDKIVQFSDSSYEENLEILGCVNKEKPSSINLYAASFADKDIIEEVIAEYNESRDDVHQINYTDYVGLMMSSITTIIDAITYVLIAFVAISLIVSSIMIGVITLISVQERTKEIGILRAIGASKKNVSGMFNAETVIIGFCSGSVGVLITYLLCVPINIILHKLTGINSLSATLPISVAIALILISMLLTLIAGIIPSRSAAKKDPVVALRTE